MLLTTEGLVCCAPLAGSSSVGVGSGPGLDPEIRELPGGVGGEEAMRAVSEIYSASDNPARFPSAPECQHPPVSVRNLCNPGKLAEVATACSP